MLLSLTVATLGEAGREARAVSAEPSTPAVYFQHVGSSDKPIFPILFSFVEVPQSERDLVLGEEARFANLVLLPKNNYFVLAKDVAARLAKAPKHSTAYDFGTFRLTLVSASGRTAGVVDAGQMVPILQQARRLMVPTNRVGVDPVAALQRRLGGGEAK